MKQIYFFFILAVVVAFSPANSYAGIDPPGAIGARSISLGYAYVGVHSDFWSLFHNPAGISGIESLEAGAYLTRRFNLKELTYGSGGVVMPFRKAHTAGVSFSSFGFEAYRESKMGLTYATTVLEIFSIGAQVNYANLSIPDHGSTGVFFVDIGLNTQLSDQLSLGFSAYNVNRAQLETQIGSEEDIPTLLTAGLAYTPSEKVLLVADIQKDVDHAVSFRGGIEYEIVPVLKARLGLSNQPLTWNAGLGLALTDFDLDFAFGYHERLGYNPHFSLHYRLGQKSR